MNPELNIMLPEILVIVLAVMVLLADMILAERHRAALGWLAAIGLAAALIATVSIVPQNGQLFGGRFVMDSVAWWFKIIFLIAALAIILLSMDMLDGRIAVRISGIGFRGEYYAVLLATIAGMMYLASARDLITLYVSLELATIPLFILAAWRRDDARAGEAGLKYVIIGAMASALMLYGFGILYGLAASTDLDIIAAKLHENPAMWLAIALIAAGMGFKMTIVPFHLWAADVYEGSTAPVVAYISAASKTAGLVLIFQILFRIMGGFVADWSMAIAIFAAATMTLGNLVAIVQQNIKRFMAFSAISQAGYLIIGFVGPTQGEAIPAMLFYMLVYVVTNLVVFGCIIWHSNQTGSENISDYRGLSKTNPLMALAMMVGLFSLAGIPPLSGFVGKFFLFSIASKEGFHWLVAVAAVNSTISLYYYLRIVRQMYIEPADEKTVKIKVTPAIGTTVAVLTLSVVILGVMPMFYEKIHKDVHSSSFIVHSKTTTMSHEP